MRMSFATTMVLGTALLALPAAAHAEEVCRINVPFPFVVQGHTLPAGEYDVRSDDSNPAMVTVDGVHRNKAHVAFMTIPDYSVAPSHTPTVTFTRRGGDYVLSQVGEAGEVARDTIGR